LGQHGTPAARTNPIASAKSRMAATAIVATFDGE
jgi:hypothetical protein